MYPHKIYHKNREILLIQFFFITKDKVYFFVFCPDLIFFIDRHTLLKRYLLILLSKLLAYDENLYFY